MSWRENLVLDPNGYDWAEETEAYVTVLADIARGEPIPAEFDITPGEAEYLLTLFDAGHACVRGVDVEHDDNGISMTLRVKVRMPQ